MAAARRQQWARKTKRTSAEGTRMRHSPRHGGSDALAARTMATRLWTACMIALPLFATALPRRQLWGCAATRCQTTGIAPAGGPVPARWPDGPDAGLLDAAVAARPEGAAAAGSRRAAGHPGLLRLDGLRGRCGRSAAVTGRRAPCRRTTVAAPGGGEHRRHPSACCSSSCANSGRSSSSASRRWCMAARKPCWRCGCSTCRSASLAGQRRACTGKTAAPSWSRACRRCRRTCAPPCTAC